MTFDTVAEGTLITPWALRAVTEKNHVPLERLSITYESTVLLEIVTF